MNRLFVLCCVIISTVRFVGIVRAEKLGASRHHVVVTDLNYKSDSKQGKSMPLLVDGIGAEPYPIASECWTPQTPPQPPKPTVVVFDYQQPVRVAALAHYFYVPGCRDHRFGDWCSGPSAFKEVKIYVSNDQQAWQQVSYLTDLPTGCPQLLMIEQPQAARYLKLEVLSIADGATAIRTYELETYINEPPAALPNGQAGKAVRFGVPNRAMVQPADPDDVGSIGIEPDNDQLIFHLAGTGLADKLNGRLKVTVEGKSVVWKSLNDDYVLGRVGSDELRMETRFVKAGLRLSFDWKGRTNPRYPRLDIMAKMDQPPTEWCIPALYHEQKKPDSPVEISTAGLMTVAAMVSNGRQGLAIVPDTDQSWIGLQDEWVRVAFPLRGETHSVLLLAAAGGWETMFRKVIADAFDFHEPRQCYPVSRAVADLSRFLLSPPLWSEKHQMLRSFPDKDFFYIFYSLPYCIPALSYWEAMTDDPEVQDKVDKILRFALARRFFRGPMKGSLFSEYADIELVRQGKICYAPRQRPAYCFPDETLVGIDQAVNRWVTSHNMGAVLWSITHVWNLRGEVPEDILAGAHDVADWMVRNMRDDGSWPYAYHPDGSEASPMSDSGTIWNVWGLYRFGQLTGEKTYQQAADKALKYFKKTFTRQHLYRGYWEDHYVDGRTTLDTGQGYESSIAAIAFAEMGDTESMASSMMDCIKFVCTRSLESRTYFSSYGQAAESTGCGPGTYIVPTIGRAAQMCWQKTGDEFFLRFAHIAKSIGWWQHSPSGGSFWLWHGFFPCPLEVYIQDESLLQFWALWDCAQKVTFTIPWLIDEVRRRSGNTIQIDTLNLKGTDDRNTKVALGNFNEPIESVSGQVNWIYLKSLDRTDASGQDEGQLVLINHAESTVATIDLPPGAAVSSVRGFDGQGQRIEDVSFESNKKQTSVSIPEKYLMIICLKVK